MVPRRLITAVLLVALVTTIASPADAGLCNINCALAVSGRSHNQHLHHARLVQPATTQSHHYHGVAPDVPDPHSFLAVRSPRCDVYLQFQALVSGSKISLTQSLVSAELPAVDGCAASAIGLSFQRLLFPNWLHAPPGSTQSSKVAPLRI